MTINEIETTLESLQERHDDLNEASLLTLLKAGGWEEKAIREALAVYRKLHAIQPEESAGESFGKAFPKIQESPVFIPEVDAHHLLLDHYNNQGEEYSKTNLQALTVEVGNLKQSVVVLEKETDAPPAKKEEKIESKEVTQILQQETKHEPQSLILSNESSFVQEKVISIEPPHNLPLKPYDATPHIWSFARYKSIFYGTSKDEDEKVEEKKKEQVGGKPKEVIAPVTAVDSQTSSHHDSHHVIHMHSTPLSRDEHRLVLLSGTMLIAILLMLGYMYGHGRL